MAANCVELPRVDRCNQGLGGIVFDGSDRCQPLVAPVEPTAEARKNLFIGLCKL